MFGFFKGKISMTLEKYQFAPGEEIKGRITLELKKNIQAQALTVQLLGTRRVSRDSTRGSDTHHDTIFDFSLPLDGEKEYPAGQVLNYDFSLKIPDTILHGVSGAKGLELGTKILGAINIAATLGGLSGSLGGSQRIDWQVIARLDSPGLDLTKKVQVNIA